MPLPLFVEGRDVERRVDIFKKLDQCFEQSSRDEGDAIANAKEERQLKQDVEAIGHSDDLQPIKQTLSEWGGNEVWEKRVESVG